MRVFTLAAQAGTLSGAARILDMSPAMATKHVDSLETRLGVKLLHRTTRKLVLTEAGEAYLEAAQRILADVDEADAAATAQRTRATGMLRFNMPLSFGQRHIVPLLPEFCEIHPAVTLELGMTDAAVDLVDDRWDIAVRIGQMHDETLQARRLGTCHMSLCAAPSYLDRHGVPRTVADLAYHNCLGYTLSQSNTPTEWRFGEKGDIRQSVRGNLRANNGEALLVAAVGGQGLVYEPNFILDESVTGGTLVALTLDHPPHELGGIYAVWPSNRHPPAKVRAMVDFLVERLKSCEP